MSDTSQLQNPYAFIDESDEDGQPYFTSGVAMPWQHATSSITLRGPVNGAAAPFPNEPVNLSIGRAVSGNPYAHIDAEATALDRDDQRASRRAAKPSPSAARSWGRTYTERLPATNARISTEAIQAKARDLQLALWRNRHEIWGGQAPSDPMNVLDPAKALEWLGYRVRFRPSGLGRMQRGRQSIEVAGLLDPIARTVDISTLPSVVAQAFTLAHELGHVALDNVSTVAHRDRAQTGERLEWDPVEREAEQFAAAFLMPERLVSDNFRERFLSDVFSLNDDTAFALCATTLDAVQDRLPTRRHLARWLASTEHYNGRNFRSLSSHFKVSDGAMAIRLEELGLVGP